MERYSYADIFDRLKTHIRVAPEKEVKTRAGVIVGVRKEQTNDDGIYFLLLKGSSKASAAPKWGFPKGARDPSDKTVLDTAMRELREETGIESLPHNALYRDTLLVHTYSCNINIFLFVLLDQFPNVRLDASEIAEYQWVHIDAVLRWPNLTSAAKDTLCALIKNKLWEELRSWHFYTRLNPESACPSVHECHQSPERS